MLHQKNPKKQGDVGLGIAIGYFASQGYTVCVPLTDSQDYDLIIELKSQLKRVQVKTTTCKTPYGSYDLNLRVCGGNRSGTGKVKLFDPLKVDYVFAVTELMDMYLIPSCDIRGKRSISLGKFWSKYNIGKFHRDMGADGVEPPEPEGI